MIKRTFLACVALLAGLAVAGAPSAAEALVVGGKNFTEQQLMAEMTAHYLRAKGYEIDKRAGMGTTVLRSALENGQIDLYWEYTGTSLVVFNKINERLSPEETYATVKRLDGEKGLVWLDPSDANNTYALAVRSENPKTNDIQTLSDLAAAYNGGEELYMALNAEFPRRPDGLPGLMKEYGFRVPRYLRPSMDSGLTYQALKEEEVDIALVFATDGRIAAFDFRVLEDDKGYFPNYALTPVVREEVLDANPALAEQLNALSAELSDAVMRQLNARVDVERETIEQVAEDFLKSEGLI